MCERALGIWFSSKFPRWTGCARICGGIHLTGVKRGRWKRIEGDGGGGLGWELCSCSCEELRPTFLRSPSYPLCPLASLVPLNKLVRFNDSYFFLVTRLPSFAPTRRLRKVAVNLVPSFAPSLSLSISATRDQRDSGLTTVRLSPSSSKRCSQWRPRYQRMQSSPIQWNRRCSWAIIAEALVRHLH